jgi:hypothetical protein
MLHRPRKRFELKQQEDRIRLLELTFLPQNKTAIRDAGHAKTGGRWFGNWGETDHGVATVSPPGADAGRSAGRGRRNRW